MPADVFAARVAGFLNRVYAACSWLSGALLIALCLLVAFGIVARLFGIYGGGATDVAGYVMASATFLALAPAFRAGAHIYVSFLTELLPPPHRRRLSLCAHAAMFFAAALLAFYLSRLAFFSWLLESRSEGADAMPLWIPQTPVAFGALLFAVAVLHGGIETARAGNKTSDAQNDSGGGTSRP
ncbi:MAG: TRAP transporter small permease [Gammaproteobacteria bacterium]